MSEYRSDSVPDSAALLQSMTLLATLSTAEDVRASVADRRAGRDPAAQTPDGVARVRLQTTGESLMDVLMQLVLSRAPLERQEEGDMARAVRQFDRLMKVQRAERLVKSMHQHLLSLYPDVSEPLVEEARHVHGDLRALLDPDAPTEPEAPPLPDVLERGISFVVWVRHEV